MSINLSSLHEKEDFNNRNGWIIENDKDNTLDIPDLPCVRVEDETSTIEGKGGENFHYSKCDEHFHADVNATRNIMHVQQLKPSAIPGLLA